MYSPIGQAVFTGETFELQCIAIGKLVYYSSLAACIIASVNYLLLYYYYRPSPELTWYKDGVKLEENNRISFSQESRILKVIDVRQEDKGVYSCKADQILLNSVMSDPASIVVKGMSLLLYVYGNPPHACTHIVCISMIYEYHYYSLCTPVSGYYYTFHSMLSHRST